MVLIVPQVARFAVNQTLEGRAVVNVLDYRIDTTGSTMSRPDAVVGQAQSIASAWRARLRAYQVDDLSVNSVSYVDLNASDGVTGSIVNDGTNALPFPGTSVGTPLPANTAALVTKAVTSARGRRNGRMFFSGVDEAATDSGNGNLLDSARVTALNTALGQFLSDTNELDTLGTAFESHMVVVSVTARDGQGNPTAGVWADVQSLSVDNLLATQRRRLRG